MGAVDIQMVFANWAYFPEYDITTLACPLTQTPYNMT